MPSIRVKSARYPHLRDIFHLRESPSDEEEPVLSPATVNKAGIEESPFRPLSLGISLRPLSVPGLENSSSQVQVEENTPVIHSSTGRCRSNTASSNSRIRAHVLDHRSRTSLRDTRSVRPEEAHTSVDRPAERPRLVRMHGSQVDILLDSENASATGSLGFVEEALNDDNGWPLGSHSPRRHGHIYDRNHHDDIVEHLDVIDRQVGTMSNLTNAANSIMIPPTGLYSRKPIIVLSSRRQTKDTERQPSEFDDPLDQHVDDLMKNPSKIRRTMMGVWSFLKTPMGILTGIYGFLVVFWGAAIVFFLGKLINLHDDDLQGFWVEVSSQVVCGLFTVTSVGFIPSRVLSTFRIYKIWHYKRQTANRRAKAGLPPLFDPDDLPDPIYDPNFAHVLTDEEHHDLHRQQIKFAYHQTWYRAHGTETHRAFPITMALWICFLNDLNSIFQIILCGTMWGMNRFERPAWSTGILIPAGFLAGIGSAVLIWRGGNMTKRVEEVRERLKLVLAHQGTSPDNGPALLSTLLEVESPEFTERTPAMIRFVDSKPMGIQTQSQEEEVTIPRTLS